MVRNLLIGIALFFTFPVSAGALEVPYQRVVQQRESTIIVETYGKGDSQYAQCDLAAWQCVNQGTSTPELFPDFIEQQYVLSHDQTLALVSDGIGSSRRHVLHTLAAGTTTQRTLLDFTDEIKKAYFSANKEKILFVTVRGEFVVFDIASNVATRSIPLSGGASFIRFSSHGNYIAYYSPNTSSGKERTYTLIDVVRNKKHTWKEKNDYWDLLSEEEKLFDFSPDEKTFYYLSDREGVQTLYKADLRSIIGTSGRIGKRMFKSNFTINNFLFGADNSLYITANRKNPLTWSVYRYDPIDQLIWWVTDDVLYYPPPVRVGKNIVFLRSQNDLPSFFAYDTETRIATPLPLAISGSFLLASGVVKKFSGAYGVLYTPDGYDKKKSYPLIIWLHGGPNRQTSAAFHSYHSYGVYDGMLEQLRKNGFIVFKLDYRGSYGYGKSFATTLKGNIGTVDVKDVVNATTALQKTMTIGEVYPMGTSYGGYLALRALAGKPALFAGAVSINGVTDWWTLINNNSSSIFKVHFNGSPSSKNKILYDQASIFSRINNLKGKKIVLVQGEEDATVPHQQTTMLYDALVSRDIDATIISYEKEGHILSDSANLDDLCNRINSLPTGYEGKTCLQ